MLERACLVFIFIFIFIFILFLFYFLSLLRTLFRTLCIIYV